MLFGSASRSARTISSVAIMPLTVSMRSKDSGGADVAQTQEGILLHGQDFVQLLRVEGLLARHKHNAGDGLSFVHGGFTRHCGGKHSVIAEYESRVNGVPGANHHL